ncbi:AMP nucleosidase [Roseiterribacter gracilis]|uniref:AMP nucleosidase n=1 Tax=Roseiterribacter gracilis TaxID=2812848 RepID=A0A8S8X749_9PROT|nr:AMP nucleosidase [Rhodospirillales bacterium TMPK1]
MHEAKEARSKQLFTNAEEALAAITAIYDDSIESLRRSFTRFVRGENFGERQRAFYPYVQVTTTSVAPVDSRLAYGFLAAPGTYRATLTRPDLFAKYYLEQFRLLLENHGQPLEVGVSNRSIPIHFALGENLHLEGNLDQARLRSLGDAFDLPDLAGLDDSVANGAYLVPSEQRQPLAMFTAARVDLSLQRLKHYTGTGPEHMQSFVIFTNYQFYVDEFVRLGLEMMQKSSDPAVASVRSTYTAFVEPGAWVTPNANLTGEEPHGARPPRLPQMPAYHLKRADGSGITMVNIGVGPSNAKTITDHIAVTRPHAWIMLGHCAGLRDTQQLGDYVLAHAYSREDHVLDADIPTWVPLPALAEVQLALEGAVEEVTGLSGYELKRLMRTGTVATTDDRNWELREQWELIQRFNLSRAIALDMESATIAANGFRFRVPYGTLLCVSDKPLHGHLKLPGMADRFYRERVDQHLKIGLRAMDLLRENGLESLHSRKLRSFAETAFR